MGDGDHYLSYAEARRIRYGTTSLSSLQVTDDQLEDFLDDVQVQINTILNPGSLTSVTNTFQIAAAQKVSRDLVHDELKRIKIQSLNIREQQQVLITFHPMLSHRQASFLRMAKRASRGDSGTNVYDPITAEKIY